MRAAAFALIGVVVCAAVWWLNRAAEAQRSAKVERRGAVIAKPAPVVSWAAAREAELRDEYEPFVAAALPDATDLKITCERPKCRIELTVPRAQHAEALALMQELHIGDSWVPDVELQCPGTATVALTLIFAAPARS